MARPVVTAEFDLIHGHLFPGEGPLAAQALPSTPETPPASPRHFLKNLII